MSLSDSSWLAANSSCDNHTMLTKDEFKISLFLRCDLLEPNLLSKCDGCGQPFTIEYTLCYEKGGLITARHDHLKFKLVNLLGSILPQSHIEIKLALPCSADQHGSNRLFRDTLARNTQKGEKHLCLIFN